MAKLILNGSTSGSISIESPAVSGTTTLTLPTTTDTLVGKTTTDTLTNKTLTNPTFDSAQLATVSGTAPLYMSRAWVNFNGTGTVAIRANGNVSSITDNGTGDYTVNFATALTDANYAGVSGLTSDGSTGTGNPRVAEMVNTSSSAMRMLCMDTATGSAGDMNSVYVAIFR